MATHKLQLEAIAHIGIVVKDVDKVVESWSSLFGIGPWTTRDVSISSMKLRIGFAYLGQVQIELIQSVEGQTLWSDFLETQGEGLHHLAFYVDDVDAEVSNLVAQGAEQIIGAPGAFAYLDSGGPGGVIFELMRKPAQSTG